MNANTSLKELNEVNWERYSHYKYYKDKIKSGYTMTVKLNVENLMILKERCGYKLSSLIYFCICRALNRKHNLNFRIVEKDDKIWAYDSVNILFKIFHEDNNTFSNVWARNNDNLLEFAEQIEQVKDKYKNVHGVTIANDKPKNCIPVSIIPWVHFESFCSDLFEETKNCFPLITIGMIKENMMPVSVYVKHSVADGFHTARLFNDIQDEINSLGSDM